MKLENRAEKQFQTDKEEDCIDNKVNTKPEGDACNRRLAEARKLKNKLK